MIEKEKEEKVNNPLESPTKLSSRLRKQSSFDSPVTSDANITPATTARTTIKFHINS